MASKKSKKIGQTCAGSGIEFNVVKIEEAIKTCPANDHVHPFYEIIWIKKGSGFIIIDFREYTVNDNCIFFISPGQVHNFKQSRLEEGYAIRFCTDFINEATANADLFINYQMFNSFDSTQKCCLLDVGTQRVENMIMLMKEESEHSDDYGHLDMIRALLRIFMVYVHRHSEMCPATLLSEAKTSHRLFVKFRKLLEENYLKLHMVKDYADLLNVSCKTLGNCVIECTGKSPLTYINDRVILEAKRQLLFSTMMTKEISFYLGFEDPSYFAKFFKRETGMLPTDFKQNR